MTASLAATGCPVERLGLDENWVDVSRWRGLLLLLLLLFFLQTSE